MNIVFCSGWSYLPEHFNWLNKYREIEFFSLIDFLKTCDFLSEKKLEENNHKIPKNFRNYLDTASSNFFTHSFKKNKYILLGWSLGAFILYPLMKIDKVKTGIFWGAGFRFSKANDFLLGTRSTVLKKMIKDIEKEPEKVLYNFDLLSGLTPNKQNIKIRLNHWGVDKLKKGLIILQNIELQKNSINLYKPETWIMGEKDKILHYYSTFPMINSSNKNFFILNQPHYFDKAGLNVIQQIIDDSLRKFNGRLH